MLVLQFQSDFIFLFAKSHKYLRFIHDLKFVQSLQEF